MRGFSLVEVIVAAAIIVTIVVAGSSAFQLYLKMSGTNGERVQSALLTQEASEAIELFRDQSWNNNIKNLSNDTTYYLHWDGTKYATTTTPVTVNVAYLVSFVTSPINRDGASGNIVTSGGSLDINTRKVTINILRAGNSSSIMSSEMLVHNIFTN